MKAEKNQVQTGITLQDIKDDSMVQALVSKADENLGVMGYTEHGDRHCSLSANIAYNILKRLGYPERTAEIAAIAAYMHDMGNVVNRDYHAQTAAILAYDILSKKGMASDEIAEVMAAIGNHDEKDGSPVSAVSAAVILADKTDVHFSRVRTTDLIKQDIHDRVNYAAKSSFLNVDAEKKRALLQIKIDNTVSSVMEYFEIFLSRMVVCRRAAEYLGLKFEVEINGYKLL
ncbi:MAG: HD domain-containing protein [candidate division Zixibacteria bacterium]|nr:HD domain-containing protein [candidate division Zixibacteria bacterium]NIR67323.1 HD domain-containing protein [candidate division Zixibacteria bacterium]NIS16200.1 HD domain-containing protein [candidate division Zixibacteria bacterium]NIS48699.1 HD domain-containing protein [candidate division Zixibacteria bacterium]NIT52592.1 HD domain-containing protein [candidate division Zixibacteria bacterium]